VRKAADEAVSEILKRLEAGRLQIDGAAVTL